MKRKENLEKLLRHVTGYTSGNIFGIQVVGVTSDSRNIKPGMIFVAIPGAIHDGHEYIHEAIEKGAVSVVGTKPNLDLPVPYHIVGDSREALAIISANFYRNPSESLFVIGITGTDGKTTTAHLIFSILRAANINVGMISTVNVMIGDQILDTGFHVTTPEAPDVQYYLSKMVEHGITHVIIETTSHGLAQHRVSAIDFDIGVLTNITHEHLDYHGSFDEYRSAKSALFQKLSLGSKSLKPAKYNAILNYDDPSYHSINSKVNVPSISYGFSSSADIYASELSFDAIGIKFSMINNIGDDLCFDTNNNPLHYRCGLEGIHNVYNCLAAIATTRFSLGILNNAVMRGLETMKYIPGRMERINCGQAFRVYVDFAHTPNALQKSIQSVRNILDDQRISGRIITVFGSAGLRDTGKRKLMAKISVNMADITIFTAEDPRSESLDDILAGMKCAAEEEGGVVGQNCFVIPDRGQAIRVAIAKAASNDIVLICGKGHEQSMCFGDVEYSWDDRVAVRSALAELLGIEGPEMPFLPTQNA